MGPPKQDSKEPASAVAANKRNQAAREVIDTLHEMAVLLNTHLTRTQLSYCVSLIENGVNPEALAAVIRELRGETNAASKEWKTG